MNTPTGSQHLDDGELVGILDGQPLHDHDSDHLADCDDCRARYSLIENRTDAFRDLLEQARPAEPAPPSDLLDGVLERARHGARRPGKAGPRWTASPLLRAAAVATILLAGALTAEPARQWLGEMARQLVAALGPAEEPPATPAADDALEVTIVPVGDRLVLRFDSAEPGARVRVLFQDRADASAQVASDASTAGLAAWPDGFRVRNAGASGTRYRFTAPAELPVEIRVGDRIVDTLRGEAGEEREIDLRRQAP